MDSSRHGRVIAVPKDVTERRERTHDLYVIQGLSRQETVDRVAEEFDAAPATVADDLYRGVGRGPDPD